MVIMLFKTNIFGIIGSDNNPDYKQNQVLIWDDLNKKILAKFTVKENLAKNEHFQSNSLMEPNEKKYSPVVVSLEDAPFVPVVSEIASQAGMDLEFKGKVPEYFSMELQSEDPFQAICSIAVKTNMKFYREGKTWYMEGELN